MKYTTEKKSNQKNKGTNKHSFGQITKNSRENSDICCTSYSYNEKIIKCN